ncbi:hypothetical protein B7494_g6108 [Chlorociboria aeruginascens]|nr:hypothetical protein B7494_g6108 [Chlorociboria aeruginascens]
MSNSELDEPIGSSSSLFIKQHPVLGNYHLPVEIEGARKSSGVHNLSRIGWDEEKCRNFMIRSLDWVPRNMSYVDGLRTIHPQLQERFGDENIDLACGVLEELIEIESPPPFPECVFQRWKFQHLHRYDDFQLPHVPHTTTIVSPIIPTKALLEWRTKHPSLRGSFKDLTFRAQTHIYGTDSPASSTFSPCIAHQPAWRIEHTMYVSIGGGRAHVHASPTPEQLHKNSWDTKFGGGGTFVGRRVVPVSEIGSINTSNPKVLGPKVNDTLCVVPDIIPLNGSSRSIRSNVSNKLHSFGRKSRYNTRPKVLPEIQTSEMNIPNDSLGQIKTIPLHPDLIPNAAFARKHGLVPMDEKLPEFLLWAHIQPTLDKLSAQQCDTLLRDDLEVLEESQSKAKGSVHKTVNRKADRQSSLSAYFGPPTPGLFFDGGLDFQWEVKSHDSDEKAIHPLKDSLPVSRSRCIDEPEPEPENHQLGMLEMSSQSAAVSLEKSGTGQQVAAARSQKPRRTFLSKFKYKGYETAEGALNVKEVTTSHGNADLTEENLNKMNAGVELQRQFTRPNEEIHCVPDENTSKRLLQWRSDKRKYAVNSLDSVGGIISRGENSKPEREQVNTHVTPSFIPPKRGANPRTHDTWTLDGASEEVHTTCESETGEPYFLSAYDDNTLNNNIHQIATHLIAVMDNKAPSKGTQPLHVRKPSNQVRVGATQQFNSGNTSKAGSQEPVYPPRTSSITDRVPPLRLQNLDTSAAQSTLSSYQASYQSGITANLPSPTSTARSTVSSYEELYLHDTPSGIMGDFIPIGHSRALNEHEMEKGNMNASSLSGKEYEMGRKAKSNAPLHQRAGSKANPYEFEPDTPSSYEGTPKTTFADFIKQSQHGKGAPTPRPTHMKNSRSVGNAIYLTREPSQPIVSTMKPSSDGKIHRSESSPSVGPLQVNTYRDTSQDQDVHVSHATDYEQRGRRKENVSPHRGRPSLSRNGSVSPSRQQAQDYPQKPISRSPSRFSRQEYRNEYQSYPSRHLTRSPSKTLDDLEERDEGTATRSHPPMPKRPPPPIPILPPSPPVGPSKVRSRSPMKKLFGEKGWLGPVSDELTKPVMGNRVESSAGVASEPKKTTMLDKIKNKFGEFAEKADLNTKRTSRAGKLSVLSISIHPPEQSRLFMELELMLVHTANNFIMSQFSEGRLSVGSIKKTVDFWVSKGRPAVIEFMYDQATQRDIVVANQDSCRFHGERAGDEIRIQSMLYSWKQVANVMAIRTFCSADTIVLKLFLDIEQVLELLGAAETVMLRFESYRLRANKLIQASRAAKSIPRGQAMRWEPEASAGPSSQGVMEDYYGGLMLVPDSFKE